VTAAEASNADCGLMEGAEFLVVAGGNAVATLTLVSLTVDSLNSLWTVS
jgi:hypothetical protein